MIKCLSTNIPKTTNKINFSVISHLTNPFFDCTKHKNNLNGLFVLLF